MNIKRSSLWAFLCGGSLGILIAFPLAAPLFDGKILEPVATLWGSALGAAAAVAGAAWIADRQAHSQQRNAAAFFHAIAEPMSETLKDIVVYYGSPSTMGTGDDIEPDVIDHDSWLPIHRSVLKLYGQHDQLRANLRQFELVLSQLGPTELQIILDLEAFYGPRLMQPLGELMESGKALRADEAFAPSRTLRQKLVDARDYLALRVNAMKSASR